MTRGLIGFVAVAVLLVTQDAAAGDKDSDAEIVAQIDQLRGIQPGKDATENERINHRLDEIWDRLIARKAQALPVIESTLRKEIEKPSADNFLLLDLGFFLVQEGQRTDDLALDALTKVDPDSRVIQANFKQLFEYTYALVRAGNPRTLAVIDRGFLGGTQHVAVPQHALDLDPSLVCVFLYGAAGPASEQHLRELMKTSPERVEPILEILNWLGTPASTEDVVRIVQSRREDAILSRASDS